MGGSSELPESSLRVFVAEPVGGDGYGGRIGSRLARFPRWRVALVVGALLFVLVGVLLLVGRDDDDGLRIVHGAPDAGFPLRGDGARDEAMIRDAADAWVRRARRDDEAWVDHGRRPDVTVLWAGRISGDTDGVVLAAEQQAAFLHRLRGRDYWQQSDAIVEDADDPVIVAGAEIVLARVGTPVNFRPSTPEGEGSPPLREDAGLWHRGGSSLPPGVLLVPDGLQTRFAERASDRPPVGVFTGVPQSPVVGRLPALRELSPALFRRLSTGPDATISTGAQRLGAAAASLGSRTGRDRPPQRPGALPMVDVVADRTLAPLGPVVVLSSTASLLGSSGSRRADLVAAAGGTMVTGGDAVATAIPLDGADSPLRGDAGPALGTAYVRAETYEREGPSSAADEEPSRVEGPFLLVAGDDAIARIEVRAGRRTVDVDPPVGLVPAPWAAAVGTREPTETDVAILGETANGTLVVPPVPEATVVPVRFED